MKRIIAILTIWAAIAAVALAIPAKRGPIKYTQPDGSVITILVSGDEFNHRITDLSGNLLEMDEDGFYYKAPVVATGGQSERQLAMKRTVAESRSRSRAKASYNNKGEKHIPVLLVNFSNKKFSISNPNAAFTNMLNQAGYSANGGTGSVRDFYIDNSDGQYTPVFDVFGPYTVSKTTSYYAGSDGTAYAEVALKEAADQANAEVDFSKYDYDGDGIVDMVLFYYAGYNQAEGVKNTIWPHQWSVQYSSNSTVRNATYDGKKLGNYFCTSELQGTSGTDMCGIGTTCHEFAHSLGLPDFYDTDYETNGQAAALFDFSTMDSGPYNNDGRTPPYFNVEERIMLGWLDRSTALKQITQSGNLTLTPVYKNVAWFTTTSQEGEYFMYEFRDGTGPDKYIGPGILVYHVDKSSRKVSVRSENSTVSVTAKELWDNWEDLNSINENGKHPCFYIVPAPDQSNLLYEHYWSSAYQQYYFDGVEAAIPFPGYNRITTYTPKDWNGKTSDISFSNISVSGNYAYMTVSMTGDISIDPSPDPSEDISGDPQYADIGYNYIIPAESYSAGDKFPLKVRTTGRTSPKTTAWTVDGKKYSSDTLTLTSGEHTISARLEFADGTADVIDLAITVR